MENQNRLKSPVFWTAIVAQVLSILVYAGIILPETSEAIKAVIASVCEILVVFGIFNNPTNKTGV